MMIRMEGLVKRGGVWSYRRMVPQRLRSVLQCREIKRTLDTPDLNAAQRRWATVNADVERMFAEADKPSATQRCLLQGRGRVAPVDRRAVCGRGPLATAPEVAPQIARVIPALRASRQLHVAPLPGAEEPPSRM